MEVGGYRAIIQLGPDIEEVSSRVPLIRFAPL